MKNNSKSNSYNYNYDLEVNANRHQKQNARTGKSGKNSSSVLTYDYTSSMY